jgi:hypothetical protein
MSLTREREIYQIFHVPIIIHFINYIHVYTYIYIYVCITCIIFTIYCSTTQGLAGRDDPDVEAS